LTDAASGVFLSYNHGDAAAALRLGQELERLGVSVLVDIAAMPPGQRIRDFIRDSIRSTRATLWLVSEHSLSSGWVGVEVTTSLNDVELWAERAFIACYLDEAFLDSNFRLKATQKIDLRLRELEELDRQYAAAVLDTNDINAEKTRLHGLRASLGGLLDYLRSARCLDLRPDRFAESVERLVRTLRGSSTPAPPTPLRAASDIVQRRAEILNLLFAGETERGFSRLLDFVNDFSNDPKNTIDLVVISASFRDLGSAQNARPAEVGAERKKLLYEALALIETVIRELSPRAA